MFAVIIILLISTVSGGFSSYLKLPPGLVPMLDGRIVGGQSTSIENFPHQISMRYRGNHRCGGSIIGQRTILTAAHCVDGIIISLLSIRAGITNRNQNGGTDRSVTRVLIHGNYNRQEMNNDIAVLQLIRNLEYSSNIRPIQMSDESNFEYEERQYTGRTAIVSGWGAIREGGPSSNSLQFVEISIITNDECSKAYSNSSVRITNSMVCAGNLMNGGKDACQGDSGGPLIIYDQNNIPKLIGVVSWGFGCARPKFPGVYARVSALRRWVDQSLRILNF